jgi:hypothetical protein
MSAQRLLWLWQLVAWGLVQQRLKDLHGLEGM